METALQKTPKELLDDFYEQYNLGKDGGQDLSFATIQLAKGLNLYFPNWDSRRRAVLKHDIHHIIAGYPSTLKGEAEISTWEISSGCKGYWAAFAINLLGMMMGIFYPRAIFRAWVRGKNTNNLYDDALTNEEALNTPVSELQDRLLLKADPKTMKATFGQTLSLFGMLLFGAVYMLLSLVIVPFVLGYSLYIVLSGKNKLQPA